MYGTATERKINIDAFDSLHAEEDLTPGSGRFIDEVAQELTDLLNDWHSQPETWDAELDSYIHEIYTNPPKVFPRKPYFSPSAVSADKRELFFKGLGYKREETGQHPMQKRWTQLGTAIGDMIQRDLLFIEKHGAKKLGYEPRFKFQRNQLGLPMFEDFAKRSVPIEHGGTKFHLFGSPDGILIYTDDDGNKVKIGLEIKSKQTTSAKTSLYSMREAEKKHEEQCIAYATMFDCDLYLILYVNTAHKSWQPSEEDFEKSPDLRVFGVECTQERKMALLDRLAEIQRYVDTRVMPQTDLYLWTFNGYKTMCALSMTNEEVASAEAELIRLKKSKAPAFIKNGFRDAVADIKRIRSEHDEDSRRAILGEGFQRG